MARATSLIGVLDADGRTYTARRLYRGDAPRRIVAVLRRIWRDVFDGDTHRMLPRLLARDWAFLDPDRAGPVAAPDLVAGIGKTHWRKGTYPVRNHLHARHAASGREWAYLIDDVDDHVLVFEASVHGQWRWHSRHPLQAAFDGLRSSTTPIAGDAATADHVGHAWRPAIASLDGLHTAWHAEVCTGEHARGVVVAPPAPVKSGIERRGPQLRGGAKSSCQTAGWGQKKLVHWYQNKLPRTPGSTPTPSTRSSTSSTRATATGGPAPACRSCPARRGR